MYDRGLGGTGQGMVGQVRSGWVGVGWRGVGSELSQLDSIWFVYT